MIIELPCRRVARLHRCAECGATRPRPTLLRRVRRLGEVRCRRRSPLIGRSERGEANRPAGNSPAASVLDPATAPRAPRSLCRAPRSRGRRDGDAGVRRRGRLAGRRTSDATLRLHRSSSRASLRPSHSDRRPGERRFRRWRGLVSGGSGGCGWRNDPMPPRPPHPLQPARIAGVAAPPVQRRRRAPPQTAPRRPMALPPIKHVFMIVLSGAGFTKRSATRVRSIPRQDAGQAGRTDRLPIRRRGRAAGERDRPDQWSGTDAADRRQLPTPRDRPGPRICPPMVPRADARQRMRLPEDHPDARRPAHRGPPDVEGVRPDRRLEKAARATSLQGAGPTWAAPPPSQP